jgi:hypothetical protein
MHPFAICMHIVCFDLIQLPPQHFSEIFTLISPALVVVTIVVVVVTVVVVLVLVTVVLEALACTNCLHSLRVRT